MLLRHFIETRLRYNFYFYKKLRAVQAQQEKDTSYLLEQQNHKFLSLLRKAYKHSPFYRRLYDRSGVNIHQIRSVEDMASLPPISKTDVRDNMEQIFIGKKFNRTSAYTSGTTGNPTKVYRNYQSIIEEGAYQWAHRIRFGHLPGMKTLVLRGNLHRGPMERLNPYTNTLELSSYHLSLKNARWYFEKVRKFRPHAIFAYPSSAESLANLFNSLSQSIRIPLIFTSSETLYGHQRSKIETTFNARVVDWYGNAERTIALQERKDHLYEEIPLYSVNIFQEDHVLSTGLINDSFPLINYRVEDIIKYRTTYSPLHQDKREISSIQGRSDDMLLLPDGTHIGLLWGAFDRVAHLQLAQVVQHSFESFDVNIVVTKEFKAEDEWFLRKKLKKFVGDDAPFTIRKVEERDIIKTKAGKYKLVINHLIRKNGQQKEVVEV